MSASDDYPVVFSETDRVYNRDANGRKLGYEEYDSLRCRLAQVCSRSGSVWAACAEDPSWPSGTRAGETLYHILSDMYNDDDKFMYVAVESRPGFTVDWIQEVAKMLESTDGWAVSVGFDDGFCIVYTDRVVVGGEMFRGCTSAADVVSAAHETDTWD